MARIAMTGFEMGGPLDAYFQPWYAMGVGVVAPVLRQGSTNYPGADIADLDTTYRFTQTIFEAMPAGGALSVAGIDALEIGYSS